MKKEFKYKEKKVNDLISIIVPVFNVKTYLKKCVNSILKQTYHNIEIVLVDDGSTDGSALICDEYQLKDERIRVVHQKNKGLSAARNIGIELAKGKYIAFVDSDDYIADKMIEVLYELIIENEAELAICNIECVYDSGEKKEMCSPLRNRIYLSNEWIEELFHSLTWYYVVAWNKLYKKELWNKVRYPVGYIHEDEAVIHRILKQCKKIVTTEEKLYYYRQNPKSIMHAEQNIKHTDKYFAFADRLCYLYKDLSLDKRIFMCKIFWGNFLEEYYWFSKDVNNQMYLKRMRKALFKVLPFFYRTHFFSIFDLVGGIIFVLNPEIYKKRYWKDKNELFKKGRLGEKS